MSQAPTATTLFGSTPWVTDPAPQGTGPRGPFHLNDYYFATPETAAAVRQIVILGCGMNPDDAAQTKVVPAYAILPDHAPFFAQNQPNQMIQMPDGSLHFAGLIALEFEIWQSIEVINADLAQEFGRPFVFVAPPPRVEPPAPLYEGAPPFAGGVLSALHGSPYKV